MLSEEGLELTRDVISKFKTRREKLGLSQEEVAYLVTGKQKRHDFISRIESGSKGSINMITMFKILKALKMNMTLGYEDV